MGKIKVTENCNGIEGLKVIEPAVFGDARGYFMETYNYNDFAEAELTASSCRTTSRHRKRACSVGFIFRSIIHRTSWYAW